ANLQRFFTADELTAIPPLMTELIQHFATNGPETNIDILTTSLKLSSACRKAVLSAKKIQRPVTEAQEKGLNILISGLEFAQQQARALAQKLSEDQILIQTQTIRQQLQSWPQFLNQEFIRANRNAQELIKEIKTPTAHTLDIANELTADLNTIENGLIPPPQGASPQALQNRELSLQRCHTAQSLTLFLTFQIKAQLISQKLAQLETAAQKLPPASLISIEHYLNSVKIQIKTIIRSIILLGIHPIDLDFHNAMGNATFNLASNLAAIRQEMLWIVDRARAANINIQPDLIKFREQISPILIASRSLERSYNDTFNAHFLRQRQARIDAGEQ
ncbi:MAG: hypothetical protein V4487_02655, partial [Chlamydiota bacterium]